MKKESSPRAREAFLFFIVAFLFIPPFLRHDALALDARSIHTILSDSRLQYTALDPVLNRSFKAILNAVEPALQFKINGSYNNSTLNIYVVSSLNISSIDSSTLPRQANALLGRLRNNVLSIPPNIIVFDEAFLSRLITNAYLDMRYMSMAMEEVMEAEKRDGQTGAQTDLIQRTAGKYNPIGDYSRLNFIRRWRGGSLDPAISAVVAQAWFDTGDVIDRVNSFMFAPVLLHELGHLKRNRTGSFLDWLDHIYDYINAAVLREEEDAADAYAAEKLDLVWRAISPIDRMAAALGIGATLKYLRDDVRENIFHGFRGLDVEDFTIRLVHTACDEAAVHTLSTPLADWSEILTEVELIGAQAAHYIDPERVKYAYLVRPQDFPVLTQSERDAIRERLLGGLAARTHSHHFKRVELLLRSMIPQAEKSLDGTLDLDSPEGVFSSFISHYTSWIDAFASGDLSIFSPDNDLKVTGLKLDDISRISKNEIKFEAGTNCGDDECAVAFFGSPVDGFVDVNGSALNLKRARLTIRLRNRDEEDPGFRNALPPAELVVLARFIALALAPQEVPGIREEFIMPGVSNQIVSQILRSYLSCGRASFRYRGLHLGLSIQTINERGWLEATITAD